MMRWLCLRKQIHHENISMDPVSTIVNRTWSEFSVRRQWLCPDSISRILFRNIFANFWANTSGRLSSGTPYCCGMELT